MTQKFYYKGGGVAIRKDAADSSGTHIVQDGLYAGRVPIYKIYSPSSLTIGSDTNRWTYDAFGRLQSIPAMITSQTYEVDGQTKSITYANGVTTQYFYSPTRRWVTRILTKDMNGVILMQNVYPRDVGGRIVSIDGNLARDDWAYTYDDLDRLLTATNAGDATRSETFTYALNDNMLSRTRMSGTYAYPAGNAPRPHAPTAIGARSFTYDANGNTLSDGLRTFTWTNDNRLASVQTGTGLVSFEYGPDGSRSKKVSSLGTTRYFGPEAEEKSSVTTRYPHTDVMIEGSTVSFLHRDHQASVKLVTMMTPTTVPLPGEQSAYTRERTGYAAFGEGTPSPACHAATSASALTPKPAYYTSTPATTTQPRAASSRPMIGTRRWWALGRTGMLMRAMIR